MHIYLHKGCSGHGTCNDTSHECTCDEGFQGHPNDCSMQDKELKPGESLSFFK